MKNVVFQNFSKTSLPEEFIRSFFKRYRRHLAKHLPYVKKRRLTRVQEIILVFTTDEKMQALNREFRKRDYVTDILSFASEDPHCLGELVLSPKKIRRQARQHGLTFREELVYLLIHGVLHLLGYEHEKSKSAAKLMFAIQDEAFESLSRSKRRAT